MMWSRCDDSGIYGSMVWSRCDDSGIYGNMVWSRCDDSGIYGSIVWSRCDDSCDNGDNINGEDVTIILIAAAKPLTRTAMLITVTTGMT